MVKEFDDIFLTNQEMKAFNLLSKDNPISLPEDIGNRLCWDGIANRYVVGQDDAGVEILDGRCLLSEHGQRYRDWLAQRKKAKKTANRRSTAAIIISIIAIIISLGSLAVSGLANLDKILDNWNKYISPDATSSESESFEVD